jgi:chromosome segregation ATPase
MRRSDRRTPNDDNAEKWVRSRREEPASPRELQMRLRTVQSQRDEFKEELGKAQAESSILLQNIQAVKAERDATSGELLVVRASVAELQASTQQWRAKAGNFQTLYLNEQGKVQVAQRQISAASERVVYLHSEIERLQEDVESGEVKAEKNYQLYIDQQGKYDSLFVSYQGERDRANHLLDQYEKADAERLKYVSLYEATKDDLKFERRSKAGIKSWETRRKRENERLKREISDMIALLKESIDRKEEAVKSLEIVATRMDRIQDLVELVEGESSTSTPLGLLQKFQKIWQVMREILSE